MDGITTRFPRETEDGLWFLRVTASAEGSCYCLMHGGRDASDPVTVKTFPPEIYANRLLPAPEGVVWVDTQDFTTGEASLLEIDGNSGDVLRESYVNHLVSRVKVYNTYGPSETTVCASYYDCSAGRPLPDGTVVPAGRGAGRLAELLRDYRAQGGEAVSVEPHLRVFEGLSELEKDRKTPVGLYAYPSADAAFDAACGALKALL